MTKIDIRSLSLNELREFFFLNGYKKFRGNQVYEWLWKKSTKDINEMSNISKEVRDFLISKFVINHIELDSIQKSSDGTIKNAIKLHDNLIVSNWGSDSITIIDIKTLKPVKHIKTGLQSRAFGQFIYTK